MTTATKPCPQCPKGLHCTLTQPHASRCENCWQQPATYKRWCTRCAIFMGEIGARGRLSDQEEFFSVPTGGDE